MYKCNICLKICDIDNTNNKLNSYNPLTHYILCDKCTKVIPFISKTESLKIYLLSTNDLKSLRTLYFYKKENNVSLFRELDVISLAIAKYNTMDKLFTKLQSKNNKIIKIKISKNDKILNRKKKLIELLDLNKLPFYYRGDPYLYINYGQPSIEVVVRNEYEKVIEKRKRTIILADALKKNGLPFDENMDACYNYINNIKCYTLSKVINYVQNK